MFTQEVSRVVPWYQVYEYLSAEGWQVGLSHAPEADRQYYERLGVTGFRVLSGPLPLGQAFSRYPQLREQTNCLEQIGTEDLEEESAENAGSEGLQHEALDLDQQTWVSLGAGCFSVAALAVKLGPLLAGRILLWEELVALVSQASARGVPGIKLLAESPGALLDVLQQLVWWSQAEVLPAVDCSCNRCGNPDVRWTPCEACSPGRGSCSGCFQCEECITLGVSRSCAPLWRFGALRGSSSGRSVEICLDFDFTPAQGQAARQVLEQVESGGNILVVAACGAGKTEITFPAIARILERGGRVLFAIPRRDVVRDLEPRLKKAFPGVRCIALYGGSEERFAGGNLVLATTHQVLRYYRSFDLVILDEVDAYPYADSDMLHRAVARAVGCNGNLVFMTATPTPELLGLVKQGRSWTQVTIPARHHGYPLPVPVLVVDKHLRVDAGRSFGLSGEVLALVHSTLDLGNRLFVFVPSVRMAGAVAEYLQGWLGAQYRVGSVHSRASRRDELITAFKEGRLDVMVTTTVLERGVTVPYCDVLVAAAHLEKVFDRGTLIQVAGRAGRLTECPTGRVWFVGGSISDSMRQALASITELNALASKCGYLRLDH
ncbi:MAG TPA: DEAD/DEAH box helicase [Bacillota bacterium]|nr:DEAD/DEAH box helicase [Bacillota bacterium]